MCIRYDGIGSTEKKGVKVLTYQMPLDVPYLGSDDLENLTASLTFDSTDNSERMKRGAASQPPMIFKDCQ